MPHQRLRDCFGSVIARQVAQQHKAILSFEESFLREFRGLEQIGATDAGGVHRLAGTAEDRELRDSFARQAERQGLSVTVDGIGNMFAGYEFVPGAPYLLVGAHLDSQPLAGRFDETRRPRRRDPHRTGSDA